MSVADSSTTIENANDRLSNINNNNDSDDEDIDEMPREKRTRV